MRGRRATTRTLVAITAALCFAAAAGAGEDDAAKSKSKAKAKKVSHLDYRITYERALLEARIRNVPVFVSRQKDF